MGYTTSYFPHDANARNDNKLINLRMNLGAEGYGIYFMILERIRDANDYMSVKDYNMLAFDLRVDASKVKKVVEDFGLFTFTEDGECFYSESFNRRMAIKDGVKTAVSDARRKAAERRWEKEKNANASVDVCKSNANASVDVCKSNANASVDVCKSNANASKKPCKTMLSKVKESKGKESKESKEKEGKKSKEDILRKTNIQNEVIAFVGSPSSSAMNELLTLQQTYSDSSIRDAMKIAKRRSNRSMKYVRGILDKQLQSGEIREKTKFVDDGSLMPPLEG